MKIPVAILFCCASQLVVADEQIPELKVGSRTFTNATLRVINSSNAIVATGGSGVKIDLEDLPEPWRSKYYDASKVEKEVAEASRIATEKQATRDAWKKAVSEKYKTQNFRIVGGVETNSLFWPKLSGTIQRIESGGIYLTLFKTNVYWNAGYSSGSISSGNFIAGSSSPGYYTTNYEQWGGPTVFVRCDPVREKFATEQSVAFRAMPVARGPDSPGDGAAVFDMGSPYKSEPTP